MRPSRLLHIDAPSQIPGVSTELGEAVYGTLGAGLGAASLTRIVLAEKGGATVMVSHDAEKSVSRGANSAQNRINANRLFSTEGQKAYSDLVGRPIKTVGDLADTPKAGHINPSQLPVDYVNIGGTRLVLNTRTSTTLEQAGIPRGQWYGRNETGMEAFPGTTFDELAAGQPKRNNLPSTGAEKLGR